MQDFLTFGLPDQLMNSLKELNFNTPTPIQAKVIPHAIEGKDILGSAQTGTGKTGAFGIPLITKLMLSPQGSALVMTPTRELAVQVIKMLESLIGKERNNIRSALLIGGESIFKQLQQLRGKPRLIVGTPGRINDHLMRGSLKLHDTQYLVLDETDRMLDMGFTPQIDKILEYIPEQRQTLLFSATLPRNILSMSEKYLNKPVRVSIGATSEPLANLKQEVLYVSEDEKHHMLISQLEKREGSIIIFVKTKINAEKIAKKLRMEMHSADAIHGNLSHHQRERAISAFRDCKYRILVATDIAARGLDIAHVKHVINFDLPQCPEDYIHRIGRTARAGAEGSALCLISPMDRRKWSAIARLISPGDKSADDYKDEYSQENRRSSRPKNNYRGGGGFGGSRSNSGGFGAKKNSGGFGGDNSGARKFGSGFGGGFNNARNNDNGYGTKNLNSQTENVFGRNANGSRATGSSYAASGVGRTNNYSSNDGARKTGGGYGANDGARKTGGGYGARKTGGGYGASDGARKTGGGYGANDGARKAGGGYGAGNTGARKTGGGYGANNNSPRTGGGKPKTFTKTAV